LLGEVNFHFCLPKITPDLYESQTEIHQNFQQRIVKATDTLHFHIPRKQKYFPFEVIFQFSKFATLQHITVLFTH